MKKLVMSLAIMFCGLALFAQSTDDIKNLLILNQAKQAKEKLDAAMTKPKFTAKPEAYLLLAATNAMLMQDPANADKVSALRAEAITAFNKYLELDPSKKMITEPPYNNAPIGFYSSYFNDGIKEYNKKDWDAATQAFTETVKWSDFLIANKVASMQFDTSALVLAGASAQNAKKNDQAKMYFVRLADKKIAGDENDFVYKFLVRDAFDRNDMAAFERYKLLGKELYPKVEYFGYSEDDFIMGMEDETEKARRIEAKIAANPNDPALVENYGLTLFEALNGENKPANYAELEAKMITNLSKAGDLKQTDGKAYYYLGNHFVNKGIALNEKVDKLTEQIREANAKAKTDPSAAANSKALVAEREKLRAEYDAEIDKGLPYLIKSAEAYGRKADLSGLEKQNYKRLADQLIIIYENKSRASKVAADKAKLDAQAKKWSDVYSKIGN